MFGPGYPEQHEFTRVGHSLFTIILAFIGGAIARQLYQSRGQEAMTDAQRRFA